MFESEIRDLESGVWADPNPSQCPCHGHGWFNSDFDVAFRCPIHGHGVPHPEDEEGCIAFDWAAHDVRIHRQAWRDACSRSGMIPWSFRIAVEAHVRACNGFRSVLTMREWVDFAFDVAEHEWSEGQDERARRMGYSCRLEASWAAEGAFEAGCRRQNVNPDGDNMRGSPERADADSWH